MPSPLHDLIQSIPIVVLIGLGIVAAVMLLLWVFLPFAIYGIKRNQKEQLEVLDGIRMQLKQTSQYLAQASVKPLDLDIRADTAPVNTSPKTEPNLKPAQRGS